jgi:hypothetical protein
MPNVKQSNLIQIMKKKKVFITVTLCMVCAISAFIGLNTEKKTDGLLLMNIEALASGESYVPMDCLGKGSVDCPGMGVKVEYVMIGWSLDEDLY